MEVIVALDTKDLKQLDQLLAEFHDRKIFAKVGMELFYAHPGVIHKLKASGHKIFLDLKLHDIPNTVEKALQSLKAYDPDIINVHALGGLEMMKRAAQVFAGTKTKVIAVTQLTSTAESDLTQMGIELSMKEAVCKLALLAKSAGLHGVVSSPLEVPFIKEACGKNFLTITPGIRLDQNLHDQKRVCTPKMARELGCDYIVVGRPITEAQSPGQIYETILKDCQ